MAIIERDVVLHSKDDNGNPTVDLPITRLANIEASADIKAAPAAGDYIPIMDGANKGQMKKVTATAFQMALAGAEGQVVGFDASGKPVAQGTESLVGPQGPEGPAGPGLPAGGAAGQVAVKKSGTDYDTQWKTLTASDVGAATMTQVNEAIQTAITGAMNASY